jgi:tetratricopeptide (TPR) repeat protein
VAEEFDNENSDNYIVCPACGARIKATRERCLRCFEPLHVDESTLPVWRSLKTSDRAGMIVAGVAGAAVVAFAVILWVTRQPDTNAEARPAPNAAKTVVKPAETQEAAPAPDAPAVGDASLAANTRVGANALLNAGDVPKSREQFEAALQLKPDDPEALNGLGLALERAGSLADAIAKFKRAAELVPDKWAYRFNLAHAEGRVNQWDQAIADYRQAIKLSPEDYPTQYNLALALHKKGDEQAAIVEYQKAIALAPSEPSFYLSLGVSLERVGRLADAVKAYKSYLELAPDADDASRVKEHIDVLAADTQKPGRVS